MSIQSSETNLQKLQQTIVSLEQQLDSEKRQRAKAQSDLKNVVKQWKQVAQELSKQHTEAKPFHTVTDDYLKQLVQELRYDVRCFSESYFEDLSPRPWPQEPARTDGRPPVCIWPEGYEKCPASPLIAQSFIWRILKRKVFERYEWPSDRAVGRDLDDLSAFLKPVTRLNDAEGPSDYDALKKFHVWRATTANMVFSADAPVNPGDRWSVFKDSLIKDYIDPVTSPFVLRPEYGRYYDALGQIIEKALILDREISRQAAWVRWVFENPESQSETASKTALVSQEGLHIITAPALKKRGKSSGEGFEEQIELLPADTCVVQSLLVPETYGGEGDDSFSSTDSWYPPEGAYYGRASY
ncbi:hypothetical protein F4678DRAFT_59178 [Xylaria arbuscula]|nr:hypothetical protein F4678DRAFT_59178 [Xylaria arbuscula]